MLDNSPDATNNPKDPGNVASGPTSDPEETTPVDTTPLKETTEATEADVAKTAAETEAEGAETSEDEKSPHEEIAAGEEDSASEESAVAGIAQADPLQTAPLEPLTDETKTLVAPVLGHKPPPPSDYEPRLLVARRSYIGAVRTRNEDACFTFVSQTGGYAPLPLFGLFVVADGMGGHYDGHKASTVVSRTVAQHVLEKLYQPLIRDDGSIMRQPIQEVMEEAVYLANKALYIPDPGREMGTTLTAALILGNRLFLVHVGDSRAYLLQKKELRPVTTDHSVVQALQDAGQLTAEEAAIHPNRNLLYRALIGDQLEQVDTFTQSLPEKGMLLLCSDGLWGLIAEEMIEEILNKDVDLQAKADRLVDEALEAGGHDNITAVLVDFVL